MPAESLPLAPGARVLVAGARVTGRAVVGALSSQDVEVTVCDDDQAAARGLGGATGISMAEAISGAGSFDLVITSPGFAPTAPVLVAAAGAGVPIWGDVELAWRLDAAGIYGPPRRWLVVTGTNGKTTTTSMLYDMLIADGRSAVLCGNIGEPVLDVLGQPADLQ
jgi:UDP-N-acetylmuramoylalanine--D-glutamate ligase